MWYCGLCRVSVAAIGLVKPSWSHTGRKALAMTATLAAVLATLVGAARAGANTFDHADTPDPFVLLHSGRYYAYSTAANVRRCDGSYGWMHVPHRSTTRLRNWGTPSSPACFSDVMPGGPGAWATNQVSLVWAPTVYRNPSNGRFVLLYSAQHAGSGQMCIGRAESVGPGGGFVADPRHLICPSDGDHWAIDANAWVSDSTHNVYLQWRQDTGATESRLYTAQYSRDGRTRLTTARLLLSDTQIDWDGGYAIENAAVDRHNGTWYLFFSGNFWDSGNYATGMASCGSRLVSGGRCSVLYGKSRPWLGWSGRSGGRPFFTTTENLPGPGGMSFVARSGGDMVRASDGSPYIAIHWWWPGVRPLAMYKLVYTQYGPVPVDF